MRAVAIVAAGLCLVLEFWLLAATGGAGRHFPALRIGVTVAVLAAFVARWPAGGVIGAIFLFVSAGLYFLGAENSALLIGVMHLVMVFAGLWDAVLLLNRRRR